MMEIRAFDLRVTAMRAKNLYFKLAIFAAIVFAVFIQPLGILKQNAEARKQARSFQSSEMPVQSPEMSIQSPTIPAELTPRIEIDYSASPVLQGASCGTLGPEPKLIACRGEEIAPVPVTNTKNTTSNSPKVRKEKADGKISIASIFLFSIAASFMMCLLRFLRRSNRNALWMFGGAAATLLAITGYIWGNNIHF